ncbi:MAG: phosphotransferase, partial [Cyanobacteria bacterium P01_G01_bin.38]
QSTVSQLLHFDADRAIAVFEYLDDYRDLADFYSQEKQYPEHIAAALGQTLAAMHQATFQKADYKAFLLDKLSSPPPPQAALAGLERPGPEIFGSMPGDGLRFIVLYQRFESLAQAIAATRAQLTPSCLTHNDLKLNNVLLRSETWHAAAEATPELPELIRLIDWERADWGDPAFDLGTLIASYLQLWLGSLIVSQDISIEESLRLAIVPLETLQPSLCALVEAYFNQFPEILAQRPDVLMLTLKLAGIALIQQIQSFLQHQKSFGNNQICMLQVAKSLLCQPEAAIPTLFGTTALSLPIPCAV